MHSTDRNEKGKEVGVGGVSRLFALLRTLGEVPEGGERVTQLAQQVGLSQPTTHRLLRSLMDEGMVEQDARSKRYRLSLEFFALAANAGKTGNLRDLVRPSMLRLSASLGDSLFLLARSASMRSAWTAAKARTRSAPSPVISAGVWHWAWGRAAWRSWRFCRRKSARR